MEQSVASMFSSLSSSLEELEVTKEAVSSSVSNNLWGLIFAVLLSESLELVEAGLCWLLEWLNEVALKSDWYYCCCG